MSGAVRTVADGTAPRDIAAVLREDGCVVVTGLASSATMDQIAEEMEPWLSTTKPGSSEFLGHATRRSGALIAKSPTARALICAPTILGVLDLALADHASIYQVDLTQLIDIGPGESAQRIHRDRWSFDNYPFPTGFEVEIATMWAVTDFTEDVGATRVIVGSNLWEENPPEADPALASAAVMAKGSVLLYTGSVYHGGGANTTKVHRIGMNIGYSLGWLRQEENQYLACPPEIARELPEGLLRLMGYQRGAFALGYVDDMRDPLDWLFGGPSRGGDPLMYARTARRLLRKNEVYQPPAITDE
ncbi:MAG: phytanoyl-CoA dioxygenase family protein [Acidimicrobiales bacterium]